MLTRDARACNYHLIDLPNLKLNLEISIFYFKAFQNHLFLISTAFL